MREYTTMIEHETLHADIAEHLSTQRVRAAAPVGAALVREPRRLDMEWWTDESAAAAPCRSCNRTTAEPDELVCPPCGVL